LSNGEYNSGQQRRPLPATMAAEGSGFGFVYVWPSSTRLRNWFRLVSGFNGDSQAVVFLPPTLVVAPSLSIHPDIIVAGAASFWAHSSQHPSSGNYPETIEQLSQPIHLEVIVASPYSLRRWWRQRDQSIPSSPAMAKAMASESSAMASRGLDIVCFFVYGKNVIICTLYLDNISCWEKCWAG